MTKEELITLGLTEEQAAKVTADYGKNYVSKAQFNGKNEELKTVKAKVAELTEALETAKQEPQTELSKLKAQLGKLTKQMEEAEKAKQEAEAREMKADIGRQTVEALTAGHCTSPTQIAKILVQAISKGDDGEYVYTAEDGTASTVAENFIDVFYIYLPTLRAIC